MACRIADGVGLTLEYETASGRQGGGAQKSAAGGWFGSWTTAPRIVASLDQILVGASATEYVTKFTGQSRLAEECAVHCPPKNSCPPPRPSNVDSLGWPNHGFDATGGCDVLRAGRPRLVAEALQADSRRRIAHRDSPQIVAELITNLR